MEIVSYELNDGTIINGFEKEYVFEQIRKNNNYYEKQILENWLEDIKESKCIFDIGANLGNHSLFWAKNVSEARIYAFEPYLTNYEMLIKNVLSNNLFDRIVTIPKAVGSSNGFVGVKNFDPNNLGSTSFEYTDKDKGLKTEVLSVDSFIGSKINCKVDFIKIDTEGFELEVLSGMQNTISTDYPTIWVEVSEQTVNKVIEFMHDHKYVIAGLNKYNILFKSLNRYSELKEISYSEPISEMLSYIGQTNENYHKYTNIKAKLQTMYFHIKELKEELNLVNQKKEELNKRNKQTIKYNQELIDIKASLENECSISNKELTETNKELTETKETLKSVEKNIKLLNESKNELEIVNEAFENKSTAYNSLLYDARKSLSAYERLFSVKLFNYLRRKKKKVRDEENKSHEIVILDSNKIISKYEQKNNPNKKAKTENKYPNIDVYFEKADKGFIDRVKSQINQISSSNGCKYYKKMDVNIGIVCDMFLYNSIKDAANFIPITPDNWAENISKIDLFLYTTAWAGLDEEWRGVASNKDGARRKNLYEVIEECKEQSIPTVFYSKEDPPNYSLFLEIAKKCDVIFTTCKEKVMNYISDCNNKNVFVLKFGINPLLHNPIDTYKFKHLDDVIFSGSWMDKYEERSNDMRMIFDGVLQSTKKLKIIDRNFSLKQDKYKYPEDYISYISPEVEHETLQEVHKLYDWAININTVKTSETMFANRAYELQAMGNILISNYSVGVNSLLPCVFTVLNSCEIPKIIHCYSDEEIMERQIFGIRSVMSNNTCFNRIPELLSKIGMDQEVKRRKIAVFVKEMNDAVIEMFNEQTYQEKEIYLTSERENIDFSGIDMITFFDESMDYHEFYLEDMINAFKYTDCDYITKDAYYCNDEFISGVEHQYVSKIKSKYRTVFWADSFKPDFIFCLDDDVDCDNGYSIDRFNYNEKKVQLQQNKREFKLSVILPIYNNGMHLYAKAFSSLRRSSMFNEMEIVMVDDGSTDNFTPKIIKYLERRYPNIVTYFYNDGGSGSASRPRNKGVALSSANYVSFLDPDDEEINDGYSVLYKNIIKHQHVDFVCGNIIKMSYSENFFNYFKAFEDKLGMKTIYYGGYDTITDLNFLSMRIQAMVIKKKLILENNIIQVEGAIGEDSLFSWQLLMNAKQIQIIDSPIHVYYAATENSITNNINDSFFRKHRILEYVKRDYLEANNLLKAYKENRFAPYTKGWFLKKLQSVTDIDSTECVKIINEMIMLYFENIDEIKDKAIYHFCNLCSHDKYEEARSYVNETI